MNKFILLPFLALFVQAKSIELIIATQELNFDRVSQILDSRNYTSQERQQALNYINNVIAENKIIKPWHKRYSALAKIVGGSAITAIAVYFTDDAALKLYGKKYMDTDETEKDLFFQTILSTGIAVGGASVALWGINEIARKYSAKYKTALAIKAILS